MADEEREEGQEPPQEGEAKKGKLAQEWRKLAGWQKAGVVIAGVGVVAAIVYYMSHQSNPTSTGNDTTALPSGMTGYTNYPGEGDQYPPMPPTQPTQSGSSSGGTTNGGSSGGTSTPPPSSGKPNGIFYKNPASSGGYTPPGGTPPPAPAAVNTAALDSASNTAAALFGNRSRMAPAPAVSRPRVYLSAPMVAHPSSVAARQQPAFTAAKASALRRAM